MPPHNNIELMNQEDFRDWMVNSLLISFAWLGIFALAGSLIRILNPGWQYSMAWETGIYVYIVVLALCRNWLSNKVCTYSMIAAAFLIGVSELMTWGLIGYGGYFLLLSLVLTVLLIGKTAGAWVFAAALVFMTTLGIAASFGTWFFNFDVAHYAVSSTSWISYILGASFFSGLIILGQSLLQDTLIKTFASLREAIGQNRTLAIRLSQVEEDERKHLARELHDEAGQWLTATQLYAHLAFSLSENKDLEIHTNAQRIIETIAKAHDAIDNVVRDLRPGALEELGLADSLRELVKQRQQQNSDVSFELSLEGELDDLDNTLNIIVYRIIQEGLTNVAKYAEASHVSVRVQHKDGNGELILSVGDNGKGMDLTRTSEGFGLRGMRERTSAVGGELMISSQLGKGVHIEARLPAKPPF